MNNEIISPIQFLFQLVDVFPINNQFGLFRKQILGKNIFSKQHIFWGKIYYGFILQRFEVLNLFFICCMAFFTYSYDNQLQKRLSSERNILNDFSSFYKEYQKLVQKSFINLQEQ
eukprot:TRINITY_DN2127_c0_g1_i12.p10 TRINITY_DN2127_c0_g1~~TRINITY_DN2127_c0_g1_i12.p10  ORF type:complete len:115 (-),score=4.22 TRINITY_DN2127_c0_g1_i12:506-850(-)